MLGWKYFKHIFYDNPLSLGSLEDTTLLVKDSFKILVAYETHYIVDNET